jgi:hypothetical protein
MNKTIIIIIVVILTFLALSYLDFLYPLNKIFPQNPDLSCNQDSDCKLIIYPEWAECRACDSCASASVNDSRVIAVNSNWIPFCPFPYGPTTCPKCEGGIIGYNQSQIKCVNHQCQKILK